MKRLGKLLSLIVLSIVVLASASCSRIHEIKVTSYKIAKVSPHGLRSVDLTVDLGIDNPSMQFTLLEPTATIYRNGVALGTLDAEPVTIPARSNGVWPVSGTINLADGVNILQVLSYAAKFNVEEYTVDYSTKVKLKSGMKVKLQEKNKPLKEFMKEEE